MSERITRGNDEDHGATPEVEALRRRVDALAAELAAEREQRQRLELILDHAPLFIYIFDLTEGRNVYTNRELAESFGYSQEEIVAMGAELQAKLLHPEDLARVPAMIAALMQSRPGESLTSEYRIIDRQGGVHWLHERQVAIRGPDGQVRQVLGVSYEITEARRAEEERTSLQAQVIAGQEALIRELASPILPLAEGVLAMPLVGTIDEARAQRILDALLDGISAHHASVALLDITGLRGVDATAAAALVRAAHAARLLGAEVLLTGVQPEVARALVGEDMDLGSIVPLRSLQAGITYALQRGRRGR